jgi:hypothetical protein
MNPLIMQMIAARAGNNPSIANFLAAMQNSDSNGGMDVQEILQQQAATNPTAALLAKHLAEQRAKQAEIIDVPVSEQSSDAADLHDYDLQAELTSELEGLRERVNAMVVEIDVLRNRNDALAAAIGACCLCWGQDLNCRSCRGRGGPGFSMPDEALFEEFVLPAIQTLRAQRAKLAGVAAKLRPEADRANA